MSRLSVQVDALLTLLAPLITDQKDQPEEEPDADDFAEEQTAVAKFISLLKAEEPDQQYVVCTGFIVFCFFELNSNHYFLSFFRVRF